MANYEYSKWDGTQAFTPQSADALFDKLSEAMMHHGDQILPYLDQIAEDDPDLVAMLQKEGLIEKDDAGNWSVSPRGVKRVQERALQSLFQTLSRDSFGKHETGRKGPGTVRHEDTRPYEFGDSLANLDLHQTIKNAFTRQGGGCPVRLQREDFVVHETELQSRCATIVLIDMSGSMGRYGKYAQTKRIALALQAMVRAQYPQDVLRMVGFYTYANVLNERELINSAPKPVSMFNPRIHMRVNLDDPPKFVPQHFTNIQAGLKLARSLLAREAAANKQIIIITDGEPTAHLEGREIVLIYPPAEKTAKHTLSEARMCASSGIRVSSFALIDDPYYLDLVNFVEQMARVVQGAAVYCSADDLGKFVFESFLGGRRVRRTST